MFDLTQKVAVVTGAGSGIGAAIAALFARQGARVVVLDVSESADATAATIAAAGGSAIARRCNIAEPDEVTRTFRDIAAEHERLHILVNNAGIAHVGTIEQTTPEDLDRLYDVNVRGLLLCSKAAVAIMLPHSPAGVGPGVQPPTYLRSGDEVAVGIDRLGQSHPRVVEPQ